MKKAYAYLIWGAFNNLTRATYYDTHMLQFHVGSDGPYIGLPLAVKLNAITHQPNLFSSNEIIQLITDYPTWLLARWSKAKCLIFSENDLEQALENISAKLPALNEKDKYLLKDPINSVAGKVHYLESICTEGKIS